MLKIADTSTSILHLVYEMWDRMIEDVKISVFQHEKNDMLLTESKFFDILYEKLIIR